jgi:hypothetical protein
MQVARPANADASYAKHRARSQRVTRLGVVCLRRRAHACRARRDYRRGSCATTFSAGCSVRRSSAGRTRTTTPSTYSCCAPEAYSMDRSPARCRARRPHCCARRAGSQHDCLRSSAAISVRHRGACRSLLLTCVGLTPRCRTSDGCSVTRLELHRRAVRETTRALAYGAGATRVGANCSSRSRASPAGRRLLKYQLAAAPPVRHDATRAAALAGVRGSKVGAGRRCWRVFPTNRGLCVVC